MMEEDQSVRRTLIINTKGGRGRESFIEEKDERQWSYGRDGESESFLTTGEIGVLLS